LSLSKNFVIEVNSESYTDLYYIEIDFIRWKFLLISERIRIYIFYGKGSFWGIFQ
jgi:hypothetical protein